MALQSIEMRELLNQLETLTKEHNDLTESYESQKMELLEILQFNDMGRFQFQDMILLKETFREKTEKEHEINVLKEQIKLREIYERSETIPRDTKEYYNVFIEYWEQKLQVIRVRNGEYSYNKYKPVVDYQIGRAKEKLEATA